MARKISTEAVINWIRLKLQSAITTPATGYGYLGTKTDKHLYFKDADGLETDLMESVSDSDVIFTDNTTNNSAITKHGYLPKLSGDSTEFLNGDGEWDTPAGGSGNVATDTIWDAKGDLAVGTGADTAQRLPTGSQGQLLSVDSAETTGLKWVAGGSGTLIPKYIVSASDSDLANEIVIPGLAGSADIAGAGGAGTSEEYDTTTTGLSWSPSSPTTVDSNTTLKSHLYILGQADNTERLGTKSWSPAGAFDARCSVEGGSDHTTAINIIGLYIANSDDSKRLLIILTSGTTGGYIVNAFTWNGTSYTARGANHVIGGNRAILRITRDGSDNITFWTSEKGNAWRFIATVAVATYSLTVAKIGFRTQGNAAGTHHAFVDWLRTDV